MRTRAGDYILVFGGLITIGLFITTTAALQNYGELVILPVFIAALICQYILIFLIQKLEDKYMEDVE